MKNRTFLAGAVTLLATLPIVGFRSIGAPAHAPVDAEFVLTVSPSADGVWICHFTDHQGPNSGDFVTFSSPPNTTVCDLEDGNTIHVDRQACKNGHQATARFGSPAKDCDTTDQP